MNVAPSRLIESNGEVQVPDGFEITQDANFQSNEHSTQLLMRGQIIIDGLPSIISYLNWF